MYKDKLWLIVGGGVSGLGAAKLLHKLGAAIRVTDQRPLSDKIRKDFLDLGAEICDHSHQLHHLNGVYKMVISPGLPANHPLIIAAQKQSVGIISEISLALAHYHGTVVSITGTNGKSTICAMIEHSLCFMGKSAKAGGNYGDPPSAMIAENRAPDFLILELSSYQLEQTPMVGSDVAIFSSFSFDHIGRHGSLEQYFKVKWSIFQNIDNSKLALMTPAIAEMGHSLGVAFPSSYKLIHDDAIQQIGLQNFHLPEWHNRLNAAFSMIAVSHLLKVKPQLLVNSLQNFRGLPHRCELIGKINGLECINDSKSTNVESTLMALKSQNNPALLMMGGQGKGEPYDPILTLSSKIAGLICFGASGQTIANQLKLIPNIYVFPTLKDALQRLGDIHSRLKCPILFSPGCASFDEFNNYEHRGKVFCDAISGIIK